MTDFAYSYTLILFVLR